MFIKCFERRRAISPNYILYIYPPAILYSCLLYSNHYASPVSKVYPVATRNW